MNGKILQHLTLAASELATTSLNWLDSHYDAAVGLLWYPGNEPNPYINYTTRYHLVRESGWYALGLLLRDEAGDRERAVKTLEAIILNQFDQPGKPYHGTFSRSTEEAPPPEIAQEWKHYDPNWREFIGVTLAIILLEYEAKLPEDILQKIDKALLKIAEGMSERTLLASYSNIALMHAFLWQFLGNRFKRAVWVVNGEEMGEAVYLLFQTHQTFPEYNSPTYYGVDLLALAMWRGYAHSNNLRRWGSEMEALLWQDIACYYHAGLKNLCGPYDRSYGMDLQKYCSLVGLCIWVVFGKEDAPFPATDHPFQHTHDFCVAPLISVVGTLVPSEVKSNFEKFQGERRVERQISFEPQRIATAWLSDKLMLGAETASGTRSGHPQYHPLTIHWEIKPGVIGWLRLRHVKAVDVVVYPNRIELTGEGNLTFQICAPEINLANITSKKWELPELTISIESEIENLARDFSVEQENEYLNIQYELENRQTIILETRIS